LTLEGIYTHYASARTTRVFSKEQARRFLQLLAELKASGIQAP